MTQKQNLSAIELDEISLVDSPACPGAKVVLMKRNDQEDVDKVAPAGIQFNLGFPSEPDGGSEVQSVIFDSKLWDTTKAKKWLEDHDMVSEKLDETANTLRFRQKDPADFKRFRVITPGKAVSKALKAKDSFQRVSSVVEQAVRDEFVKAPPKDALGGLPYSPLWIRDLYKDSAVFDQDGQTYRVDYSVDRDENSGELKVTLGDKVAVDVVYQDVKKSNKPLPISVVDDMPDIPDELKHRVLKMRMDVLQARLRKNDCHVPSGSKGGQFCSGGGKGSGAGASGGAKEFDSYRQKEKASGSKGMISDNDAVKALMTRGQSIGGSTKQLDSSRVLVGMTSGLETKSPKDHTLFFDSQKPVLALEAFYNTMGVGTGRSRNVPNVGWTIGPIRPGEKI